MNARHHRGFTLIEIAIALTVISLILGGVLIAGNSMIERSRVAALLSKIKDLGAAARDFKSRYGYFPGDLPNPGSFIKDVSATCASLASVGNGLVDSAESSCALEELVRAELLTKVEIEPSGKYFIGTAFTNGRISLWVDNETKENVIQITSVPCQIALELDRRLDNDSTTPLNTGLAKGLDNTTGLIIPTCEIGGKNDAVTLFVKY